MAIYTNIFVYLNGALLAEAVTVDTTLDSSQEPIFSVTNNFEGMSPGPFMRTINVGNVVPIEGAEFDFEDAMVTSQKVEMILVEGGTGWHTHSMGAIVSVSRSGSVGKTAMLSFTFKGTSEPFTI